MHTLFEGMDIAKVMMGQHAFHIPLNLICQSYLPDTSVAGVFQTKQGLPLLHQSDKSHIVILGDAIIRPRVVVATDELQGRGISSLFTSGFLDAAELIRQNKTDVLLNLLSTKVKK